MGIVRRVTFSRVTKEKAMDVEKNCPTCQHNLEGPRCGVGRMRINKNKEGEWVKNVFCPAWKFKTAPISRLVDICPTCGQPLPRAELVTGKIGMVEGFARAVDEQGHKDATEEYIELCSSQKRGLDESVGIIPSGPPVEPETKEEPPAKKAKKRSAKIYPEGRKKTNG
jgi:endogenous inhibitor of DNA gyrase (YacG/DUF329 family)